MTRESLAPRSSGEPARPMVCRNCGASMSRPGRHLLPTLDDNHRAEAR